MLPRLLRITSKVYLYDTSAPGLLDTGLLRLLRRVRWSCGQCAFALYTVPRRTDHALLLHYAAESVRLRHGCPQNTNLQQQHQHLPGRPPHQGCSGQAKSTPKTSTHNFAIKACQESQRSLQRPTPPPPTCTYAPHVMRRWTSRMLVPPAATTPPCSAAPPPP